MNVRRIVTAAAASSAFLALAASSAGAADFGSTLSSAAQTASTAGERAKPAAEGVLGDKMDKKVGAVKGVVKAGADAAQAGNDLVS